jgi:cobalamin biosynthesis Mg chelatase CobN
MTDVPEKLWVEPDGETLIIHNGISDLDAIISTGYLYEYTRTDVADAREVAAINLVQYFADTANTQQARIKELEGELLKCHEEIEWLYEGAVGASL